MDAAHTSYRLICDAYSSLNKKKFQESILILEKVLSSGTGDIYILLLLSVGYLYTDQFGKLARFIEKMRSMNREYLSAIQLEAFLKLKAAANQAEALGTFIELTAKYPADPHIHRGRTLIGAAADFRDFQKNARLQDFVYIPRPPRSLKKSAKKKTFVGTLGKRGIKIEREGPVSRRWVIRITAAAAVIALAVLAGWLLSRTGLLMGKFGLGHRHPDFRTIDQVTLSGTEYDLEKKAGRDATAVYYQSAREMNDDFNRARNLIKAERYNDALFLLNGLYNSNVNFVVKEKVDFLIKFVIDLEDRDYAPVSLSTINRQRYRYRGYAVRWKGAVRRIKERSGGQFFTMLLEGNADSAPGEADVYSRTMIPGLSNGARVLIDGVIVDFIGTEHRAYLVSRNLKIVR